MTSQQIECFIRLSQNLSFAKTAKEMYLNQSSVSREIKSLEHELEFDLFIRDNKSVRLTLSGEKFLETVRPMVLTLNNTISQLQSSRTRYSSILRIGYFHNASLHDIPSILAEFHRKFPDVYIEICQGNLNKLQSRFQSGQLDMILGMKLSFAPDETDCILDLYKGYFVVTLPRSNPLSRKEYLSYADINGQDILVPAKDTTPVGTSHWYNNLQYRCPDSTFIHNATIDEQEFYLKAGIGMAISVQYSFVECDEFCQIPLIDDFFHAKDLEYSVMWHNTQSGNHLDDFIDMLKEHFSR